MAFDTMKWLTEDMGFTAEEAAALRPQFESRGEKVEKGYLRQSDYSREMNTLKKTQSDLAAANDKLTADMAEWAELTAAEKAQAGDLRAQIDAANAKIFTLQQKATRLAEDAGIDPKTIVGDDVVLEPKKPTEHQEFDPKPLQNMIGGVTSYMLRLNAKLPGIMREHHALTGEDLDVDAFISGIEADIKANKTENLDPTKRWESQHGIAAKRTERAEADRTARDEAMREEGRVAARSEAMLPNTRPMGQGEHGSPVLRSATAGGSKLQRPQPADRLSGARQALAIGKYRGAVPATQ